MKIEKIKFNGNFWHFALQFIAMLILTVCTLGILLPLFAYWFNKYFVDNFEINIGRINFKGSFGDYFLTSFGLEVVTICTFGLLLPYFIYWNIKYFVDNLELELYD